MAEAVVEAASGEVEERVRARPDMADVFQDEAFLGYLVTDICRGG